MWPPSLVLHSRRCLVTGSSFGTTAHHSYLARRWCVRSTNRWFPSLPTKRCFGSASSVAPSTADGEGSSSIRLSKLVASKAGISRREAERWIRQGDVTLAGKVVQSPQQWIDMKSLSGSELKARGKALKGKTTITDSDTRVWLVHKVTGELVADSDPMGRPCFMPRISSHLGGGGGGKKQHLKAVGRLDMNTEGLVVITNNGQYAREMEIQDLHRVYRVRAHGRVPLDQMQRRLRRGLVLENGLRFSPMKITLDEEARRGRSATNTWFQVTCTQGKNRQVRKVFEHFGLTVTRLIRISYGDYHLHSIPPGMTLPVPVKPIALQKRRGRLFPPPKKQKKKDRNNDSDGLPLPIQWIRH